MIYSPEERAELLEDLIEWLSDGNTLRQFARDNGVSYGSIYSWINAADATYAERIACAREAGYEKLAEETLDIADGTHELATGDVARDKLRVHTRQQLLAKWAHARYGERQRVDHAGINNQPITIVTGVPANDNTTDLSAFE